MRRRCVPGWLGGVLLALVAGLPWTTRAGSTHCLWRISNATNHVYLQGSVHLLKKSHYPLPDAIEKAYAAAAVLVLEADLSGAQDPAQQMAILKKGMLEGGATLQETLSQDTWTLAEQQVAGMGMHMALFNGFKPWYFATSITAMRLQSLGFSPFDGVDWHFFNRATTDGKPVVGLETLDYQMGLFDAISADNQDALVRQTLEDLGTIEQEMDTILAAWSRGDLEAMDRALLKSFRKYPAVYKSLVTDRNHNWVPLIVGFLESGTVHMVVVGAGHLSGREGLLKLLERQGLKLEQL